MCDYCDGRSHPVLAALSEDHVRVLGLLGELRRAADGDDAVRAAAVAVELDLVLGAHADAEERGVFAKLREAGVDTEYVDRFEHDHHRIHALLDGFDAIGWQHAARDLVALLAAHIDREETDLFPAAHQLLTPDQWAATATMTGARA